MMNPDFGGITRPHGSLRIKRQMKALAAAEDAQRQDIDHTGKLAGIIAESRQQPIGDPPQE